MEINNASISEMPQPNSFRFSFNENVVIEITEQGFKYKGELIEDSGEVYKLFKSYLESFKQNDIPKIKCDFCGKQVPTFMAYDVWHIMDDGKNKCYSCQKNKK